MATLVTVLAPLILLSGVCLCGETTEQDDPLNIIGTDIVNDIKRVFIPYSRARDESKGPPPAPDISTSLDLAGITIKFNASNGTFRDAPSIKLSGRVKVHFSQNRFHNNTRYVLFKIPVKFDNFDVHYDQARISGLETPQEFTVKVKRNEFLLTFSWEHRDPGDCFIYLAKVEQLQFSGLEFNHQHVEMKQAIARFLVLPRFGRKRALENTYTRELLSTVFDSYMGDGFFRYCTYLNTKSFMRSRKSIQTQ